MRSETYSKIPKLTNLQVSKGFSNLFKIGIESLEKTASDSWTDYNAHDPGITLLDILAYVLSELGLQIDQTIEDLLASQTDFPEEQWKKTFPLPTQILTTYPQNLPDLKKMFLSLSLPVVSGSGTNSYLLQNIFIRSVRNEVSLFFNGINNALSFTTTDRSVSLSGLYELNPEFADYTLNENYQDATISDTAGNVWVTRFFFPYWDQLGDSWVAHTINTIILVDDPANPNDPIILLDGGQFEDFFCEAEITFSGTTGSSIIPIYIQLISDFDPGNPVEIANFKTAAENFLENIADSNNPIQRYRERYVQIDTHLQKMLRAFDQYRSIGEDIESPKALKIQDIAINTEIEIKSDVDPVLLSAQLFLALETAIAPPLKRKSLNQLRNEMGLPTEDIIQGPVFNSGWIKDADLEAATVKKVIYTSDLVRIIMDFEEVIGINFLNLSSFINNIKVADAIQNCLEISGSNYYIPRFNAEQSKVVFIRSNRAILPNYAAVKAALDKLRAQQIQKDLPAVVPDVIPLGGPILIGRYRSLQYDFPPLYYMGNHELPADESPALLGKNKQWRAFTFFFDQLLANHYGQLANLGETFAVNRKAGWAYPFTDLSSEPALENILDDFYPQQLDHLASDPKDYIDQRQNVLDHLLSRFAEDLASYVMTNRGLFGKTVDERLVRDKELFLEDYPILSQRRINGLDLSLEPGANPVDRWNTEDISGFEFNIKRRLGIRKIRREALTRDFHAIIQPAPPSLTFPSRYHLLDTAANPAWESVNILTDEISAYSSANMVFLQGIASQYYESYEIATNRWGLIIKDKNNNPIVKSIAEYPTRKAALAAVSEHQENILKNYSEEGLFLVEHILLRPQATGNDDDLLKPFANIKDPYSFVITLVFPSGFIKDFNILESDQTPTLGYNRLREAEFRQLAESVVQQETPAQCLIQVFFLDADLNGNEIGLSLHRFEKLYRDWITTVDPRADTPQKVSLIKFLNELYA